MTKKYDQYDLFEHVDNFLTRPQFVTEREKRFYPSEASVKFTDEHGDTVVEGGCLRASYFRITGEAEAAPYDARTEFIFKQGNSVESMLINIWKEMGIWYANNVKFVDKEHNISGEIDALLIEPGDGTVYGVEVKSFYGYHAEKELFGNRTITGKPKISQLLQTLIYAYQFRDRIPYFRMVYFARDSVKRKTFKIELHQEGELYYPKIDGTVWRNFTVNDIFDRYKQLQEYIDKGETPPKDYELQYPDEKIKDFRPIKLGGKGKIAKTKYEAWEAGKLKKNEYIGDWQCNYCKFKNTCYGND